MKKEHIKTLIDIVDQEIIRADMLTKDAKHCYTKEFEHLEPKRDQKGNIQSYCDYACECPFQVFSLQDQNTYCGFADQYNKMNYKVFFERMGYLNK